MRKLTIAVLVALGLSLGGASAATAAPTPSLQDQIDAILLEHPGGVQTGPRSIAWDGGATRLVLAGGGGTVSPLSVGSCATGFYCAFNGVNLTGSQISFSACSTTVSTSALPGFVRSLADARSTGYIQGLNSSGTALTTVSAGGQNNSAPSGITQLRCVV